MGSATASGDPVGDHKLDACFAETYRRKELPPEHGRRELASPPVLSDRRVIFSSRAGLSMSFDTRARV